jgi:hypothetical protein
MRTFIDMVIFLQIIPSGQSCAQKLTLIEDVLFLLGCIDLGVV